MSEIERCFKHMSQALVDILSYLRDAEERLKTLEKQDKYHLTCPKCKNIRLERFMSDCSDCVEKQTCDHSNGEKVQLIHFGRDKATHIGFQCSVCSERVFTDG